MKNSSQIEEISVTTGLKRRDGICSNTKQEVAIVIDASPSMDGHKAQQAQSSCEELVAELAQPINKNGFIVTVIHFNGRATVIHPWTPASELSGMIRPLDIDSATNMTDALKLAGAELASQRRDPAVRYLRPVVVVLSDGLPNAGGSPVSAANDLNRQADVVMVGFGDDADEALLKALATSPQHYYRVSNGAELRHFMAQVGDTLTIGMAQKRDATRPLAMLEAH